MADDKTRGQGIHPAPPAPGPDAAHPRQRLGRDQRQGRRRRRGHHGAGHRQPLDRRVVRLRGRREHPARPDARAGQADRRRDRPAGHRRPRGRLRQRAETIRRAIGLGVVGANIEDQLQAARRGGRAGRGDHEGRPRRRASTSCSTPAPTRSAQGRDGDPAEYLADAIERGKAYLDAGAPVVFVPAHARRGRDPPRWSTPSARSGSR